MHLFNGGCIFCYEKPKGGVNLASTGYIQVHAYTSFAQIPLQNVAISITDTDGKTIAFRLTDRNGKIDPVPVSVPAPSAGQTPDTGITPYTNINISARLENFEQIESRNVQIFPSVITNQNLEMIPLSERPQEWTKEEVFLAPPQNL